MKKLSIEKNSDIDVNQVKNIDYYVFYDRNYVDQKTKLACDSMKMIQSTFSKKLPAERYNGIMNVYYVILNPNATTDEITTALVIKIFCSKMESCSI